MPVLNTIRFTSPTCDRAEAIFGDTLNLLYNGRQVWQGPVNTNDQISLPNLRHLIIGGIGGNITIDQWYFGKPSETVHRERVIQKNKLKTVTNS